MASESFIHALLLCLGLFLKISHWAPLSSENQNEIDGVVSRRSSLAEGNHTCPRFVIQSSSASACYSDNLVFT